jgi:3-oxoadipate enol-lactonase
VAEDTAGLARALTIPRAHVLGVCMGGRIALARTLAHPERVEKLVLVSTSARTARRPWWVGPVTLLASGLLFRSRYPQPRDAFRRQREASSAFDCSERVPDIHAPTLILHGTADKTVPYALAEQLQAGIAGSTLIPFAGATSSSGSVRASSIPWWPSSSGDPRGTGYRSVACRRCCP